MNRFFSGMRGSWLRAVLAVLLPLHAGFAQAAMSATPAQAGPRDPHPAAVVIADESMAMPEGMPCHHDAVSPASQQDGHQHKGGCCDAGSCHCAAVCGLSFAIVRMTPQPGMIAAPFAWLSSPAQSRPPDLRPPIG